MTIETRLSFPEGGTECPPDENLVSSPGAGSSSSSNSSNSGSGSADKTSNSKPVVIQSHKSRGNRVSSRYGKLRPNCLLESTIAQEPSKVICGIITPAVTETAGEGRVTSVEVEVDAVNSSNFKIADLKKSAKTKCLCDGSKDEAASRKSMRLRLRRGNGNGNDFFVPKERPRYVEDLTEIDFTDENIKILFMDALGMSPRCKEPKPDLTEEDSANGCNCPNTILRSQPKTSNELGDYGTHATSEISKTNAAIENDGSLPQAESSRLTCFVKQSRSRTNSGSSETRDDWECWVSRLPASCWPPKRNSVPSNDEINESLKRLIHLGTTVKIVTNSI